MCDLEIRNYEVDKSIEIMREVAKWERNKGLRICINYVYAGNMPI